MITKNTYTIIPPSSNSPDHHCPAFLRITATLAKLNRNGNVYGGIYDSNASRLPKKPLTKPAIRGKV
jgi:hypothetical protein